MKKLAVTLCLSAIASVGFAQGTVTYANASGTAIHTNSVSIGGTSGNTPGAAGGFLYEVLTAPSTVTALTDATLSQWASLGWLDTSLQGTNTTLATGGRAGAGGTQTVNNWQPGVEQAYVIVGWSASEASSWSALSAKLADAHFTGTGNGQGYWDQGGLLVNGGFLGVSGLGTGTAGGGAQALPPWALYGSTGSAAGTPIGTTTELYVVNVPEPTSMALAGLGLAAGLILRRRK